MAQAVVEHIHEKAIAVSLPYSYTFYRKRDVNRFFVERATEMRVFGNAGHITLCFGLTHSTHLRRPLNNMREVL